MKVFKTILATVIVLVAFTSCTAESIDDDETLVNGTDIIATGGAVDHTSTPSD